MEEDETPAATGGCKQMESQESSNILEDPDQEHTGTYQECLKLIRTKPGKQTAGYDVGLDVGDKPTEAPVR